MSIVPLHPHLPFHGKKKLTARLHNVETASDPVLPKRNFETRFDKQEVICMASQNLIMNVDAR